ncbi:MAG: hypothetical protein GY696_12720 [Gammaproteobacteria bacterium]|nr:hypothetical protein [Gammaproteobacteria bacterium]
MTEYWTIMEIRPDNFNIQYPAKCPAKPDIRHIPSFYLSLFSDPMLLSTTGPRQTRRRGLLSWTRRQQLLLTAEIAAAATMLHTL